MMPNDKMAAAQSASNSSDFVRKLYKMLEEPEYTDIVRWGNEGDSFVVLESDKFSSTILPKHFKHSNFASFVRQLNKYDFHKVRRQDESGPGYGANTWEFRHPDFRVDCKDNLDTIRRKAPASRKPQPQEGAGLLASQHQLACLTENVYATQKQVQQLQAQVTEASHANQMLVKEIVSLQKTISTQRQAQHEMLSYLENRARGRNQNASQSPVVGVAGAGAGRDDQPELRRVRELLSGNEADPERLHAIYPSPADSATSSAIYGPPPPPDMSGGIHMMNEMDMSKFTVYPVGQTVGIDPFHSDHIHNIPYPIPPSASVMEAPGMQDTMSQTPVPQTVQVGPQEGVHEWGPKKPYVYLVEDDKICAKIGAKFLTGLGCTVERAKDGLEAVSLFNRRPPPQFDLIFMDIIMPKLDGVSATACIRDHLPQAPIIAMTSNIRQEDLSYYFKHGMNDVLAKPFTKEGMLRMLKKHLPHLLNATSPHSVTSSTGVSYPAIQAPMNALSAPPAITTTGLQVKFEGTPIQSPATATGTASWHSPGPGASNTPPGASPLEGGYVGVNNSGQLVMTPVNSQRPSFMATTMGPPGASQPDIEDNRPEKRQRMMGPQGTYVQ